MHLCVFYGLQISFSSLGARSRFTGLFLSVIKQFNAAMDSPAKSFLNPNKHLKEQLRSLESPLSLSIYVCV